jgi:hypothetical protein
MVQVEGMTWGVWSALAYVEMVWYGRSAVCVVDKYVGRGWNQIVKNLGYPLRDLSHKGASNKIF